MSPVVRAPKFDAPATDNVPLTSVFPVVRFVEKRFVDDAVVAKDVVEVALVVVEFNPVKFWRVVEARDKIFPNVPNAEVVNEPVKLATDEIV